MGVSTASWVIDDFDDRATRRTSCRPTVLLLRAFRLTTTNSNEWYVLRPPQSSSDWAAYHSIRRDSIFALYLPERGYDEKHPDEFKPGNLPHILVYREEVVGTVRVDLIDRIRAGFRLIGIRTGLQRQGHGAALLLLSEQLARRLGRREITINATSRSLPFYLKHGYAEGEWRDNGPVPDQLIRVGKHLP
jgi:GNAT superfamily N-acetyltransferase